MDMFCARLDYEVSFHPVDTTRHQVIYEDRSLTVESLPLEHRVPCCGFLFREKPTLPHIRREMIDFYGIPTWAINRIKAGDDWTAPDGTVVPHQRLTTPPDPVRSYAYCSDTMAFAELAPWIQGADLLYHEATYASSEGALAEKYGHSTALQAATIAHAAGVKRLLLGHFSSRYDDEDILLNEAKAAFPYTSLAREGLCIHL
jgi:ribonuclease Z